MDIWQHLKELFHKSNTSSKTKPLVHELIKRTDEEQIAYSVWKNSLTRRQLVNWLIAEYSSYKSNPFNIDASFEFMDNTRAKGFVMHYNKDYSAKDYQHLMDYFKERTLELGYQSYMSDIRSYEKGEGVETVQRHYLKPRPNRALKGPINQRFGNITIELTLQNEETTHLKLMAMGYSDHLYQQADDFKEYIFHLRSD